MSFIWRTNRQPENGEPLPGVIDNVNTVLKTPPPETFCRNKLVLKPVDCADKLIHTTDDA